MVLVTSFLLPMSCVNGSNEYDNGVMRTDMSSFEYAEDMGFGINLGNTMEAFYSSDKNKFSGSSRFDSIQRYETCWGAIGTTQEIIDGMKNAGFDTVRIPVYWGNAISEDGEFIISDSLFDRVEEIINYCRNSGLYVVINIHHYDEFLVKNYSEEEALEITKKLWTQIAERYKNYSDYLIFEGFNENLGTVREIDTYTSDQKYDYVNKMNQVFVDAVRATGGNNKNRLLVVSGYWTNIDLTTSDKFIVPTDSADDRIMVSVHYIDNSMYWSKNIGNQKWLDYSKAQCELLKKAFTDNGYPVFVGECTAIYDEKIAADAEYTNSTDCLEKMYEMISEYGFVPVLWDVNNGFYSRTECRIKSEPDRALINKITE